jgi:putative heme iron utilization protein
VKSCRFGCLTVIHAQLLYAAPSHLVCIISGEDYHSCLLTLMAAGASSVVVVRGGEVIQVREDLPGQSRWIGWQEVWVSESR